MTLKLMANFIYRLVQFNSTMGKKYAPGLDNLYLLDFDNVEMRGLNTERGNIKPISFKRYLDDIFIIEFIKKHADFEHYLHSVTDGINK